MLTNHSGTANVVNVTHKRILVELDSRRSRYPPPHEDNVSRQIHAAGLFAFQLTDCALFQPRETGSRETRVLFEER